MRRLLLTRTAPRGRELLVMLVLLSGLATLTYHSHVMNGGFYADDWPALAGIKFQYEDDPIGAFERIISIHLRPVGALSLIARFTLLGDDTELNLGLAVVLTVFMCFSLYLLLRTLRLEPLHAGAIVILVLVCPYADATRLWATGSGANIAIGAWLLGVVLAIRGLEASSRRSSIALHGGAVTLYCVSLMQYEIAYAAIVVSGFLYAMRAPWHRVWPRSLIDIVVTTAIVTAIASNIAISRAASYTTHARLLFESGLDMLAVIAIPYGAPRTTIVLLLLSAIVLAGVTALRALPRRSAVRGEIVRWLLVAAAGAVTAAAGYAMFVGASEYYTPAIFGVVNRINAIASIGFIVMVYAAGMLAITIAGRRSAGALTSGTATVGIALGIFLFVGYQERLSVSAAAWDRASAQERWVLDTMKEKIPELPSGSKILTFGHRATIEDLSLPNVWAFSSAVRLAYRDSSLSADPALPRTHVVCGHAGAYLSMAGYDPFYLIAAIGAKYGRASAADYGKLFLLDVPSGRVERLNDRSDCLAVAPDFRPGPFQPAPSL